MSIFHKFCTFEKLPELTLQSSALKACDCNVVHPYIIDDFLRDFSLIFLIEIELVAELKSQIPDVDNIFKIHRRIGEGTFSTVFLTSLRCQEHSKKKRFFALKYLVPTSHPKRIARELKCLKEIG